jgi:hypothetical protein
VFYIREDVGRRCIGMTTIQRKINGKKLFKRRQTDAKKGKKNEEWKIRTMM